MKQHGLFIRELSSFHTFFNKLHHFLDLRPNRFTSKSQSENWNLNLDASVFSPSPSYTRTHGSVGPRDMGESKLNQGLDTWDTGF